MNAGKNNIPVALFAYNRPDHLKRTLGCLRQNKVPLIYAFSDGPKSSRQEQPVADVRNMLREIDWCDLRLTERKENLGLGRSILTGVTEVFDKHESAIIFEDDLICVPGAYAYLSAALEHYKNDDRVMSVTGWTHPRVTPSDVTDRPYFDGRAECWVWGTWARVWREMKPDAKTLMGLCAQNGIDINRYGSDLPKMAEVERIKNIWAVRFLYCHILNKGLCLRPPWSMVEHTGFDQGATNATDADLLKNPELKPCPAVPAHWPEPLENGQCPNIWQREIRTTRVKARYRQVKQLVVQILKNYRRYLPLFVPPVFEKLASRAIGSTRHLEYEMISQGWDYAKTHPEVRGWNVTDVLDIYKAKWPKFVSLVETSDPLSFSHESRMANLLNIVEHNIIMTFAYVTSLSAHRKTTLTMLDWGGGIGHYYVLARALLPHVTLDYHCKDVPVLARHGAELFADQHFYSDDSCFSQRYDLVMASTSLHYEKNWQDLLGRLAKATEGYLYIANMPVIEKSDSFVFIQRPYSAGYNTEYLAWCINRHDLIEQAARHGLSLVRAFVSGHHPRIRNAPEQNQYMGFLFQANGKNNEKKRD